MYILQTEGETARLVLTGEVDLQSTSEMKAELEALAGVTRLEINAADVSYIDSSGVAVLLLARKLAAERNIALTIPVVSAMVFRVLELARLETLLPIGSVNETGATDSPRDDGPPASMMADGLADTGAVYDPGLIDAVDEFDLDGFDADFPGTAADQAGMLDGLAMPDGDAPTGSSATRASTTHAIITRPTINSQLVDNQPIDNRQIDDGTPVVARDEDLKPGHFG